MPKMNRCLRKQGKSIMCPTKGREEQWDNKGDK